jgi:hypothetical protein
MRYYAQGMTSELLSESSEEEGMPSKIHQESHKVSILPVFTPCDPHRKSSLLHEARKESEVGGLTSWIVYTNISPLQAPPPGEPGERR